ncbi:MAG: alpha/beta fold hydrolase [Bacteroidota bacterium]
MLTHQIKTTDQYKITISTFAPKKPNQRVVLISAATGIKQSFYYHFAAFLSQKGYTVITYDYRGIGQSKQGSLRKLDASMVDWAAKDTQATIQFIFRHYPDYKKILIGHSFGGNSMGLCAEAQYFDAYVTVASQFGYWRHFEKKKQGKLLWFFYVVMPLLSRLVGYFPANYKQLGENLPRKVALDWVTLITHPDSMLEIAKRHHNYYPNIKQPMLMISIEDDWMAPQKAVDTLAQRAYTNAAIERKHITLKETGTSYIGHVSFFKRKFQHNLWNIPIQWINQLNLT